MPRVFDFQHPTTPQSFIHFPKVCVGKVVDLPVSGYNPRVLPYGWLSTISGLAKFDIELEEPFFFSLKTDYKIEETRTVVKEVKENLKGYWKCFA